MTHAANLGEAHLPGLWKDADSESTKGQKWSLRLTVAKAGGGVVAALGGAISIGDIGTTVGAWIILFGFASALVGELLSWIMRPERSWYEGRAVAESVKTLAWRYSVCADPFPPGLSGREATDLLRERIDSVTAEFPDLVNSTGEDPVVTNEMKELRSRPFKVRRDAYVSGRTSEQQRWYSEKANMNQGRSNLWRFVLIAVEVVALVLAFGKVVDGWSIDYAGLLGAFIAAGAAWVAVKQFSPLASAYSIAARELKIQASKLGAVDESEWPSVVADAEEAISREHTTWLASRTGNVRKHS